MSFVEIPVSEDYVARRKLICGIGINDVGYMVNKKEGVNISHCPYFSRWSNMIHRCYNPKSIIKKPAYRDCSVCDEWLIFSNFRAWMKSQDWKDKCLDKDILKQGNRIYSPSTCIFVSLRINNLFITGGATRGELPLGVHFSGSNGKYQARCSFEKKLKWLGCFNTSNEAYEAYKKFKYQVIRDVANEQQEPLKSALLAHDIDKTI